MSGMNAFTAKEAKRNYKDFVEGVEIKNLENPNKMVKAGIQKKPCNY